MKHMEGETAMESRKISPDGSGEIQRADYDRMLCELLEETESTEFSKFIYCFARRTKDNMGL